jgi:hypothetical protein
VARSDTMALEGTGVNLWKTQEVSYSETLGNSTWYSHYMLWIPRAGHSTNMVLDTVGSES